MHVIDTHKVSGDVFRCVVFFVEGNNFWGGIKTVVDVFECHDLRKLSTHTAKEYPDAAVLFHHPNPHTDYEFTYGDAMSLAEVIEAEFEHRPGREEAAREWERMLEVTGGSL